MNLNSRRLRCYQIGGLLLCGVIWGLGTMTLPLTAVRSQPRFVLTSWPVPHLLASSASTLAFPSTQADPSTQAYRATSSASARGERLSSDLMERGTPAAQDTTSNWHFGVAVEASGGAGNVTVVFPIPQSWPDQDVEWSEAQINPPASQISQQELDGVTLVTVKWRIIPAGETASIRIPAKVTKHYRPAPADTSGFVLRQGSPGKLKLFLQPSPYIESGHRKIKQLAEELPIDTDQTAWRQVEQIYDWVRDHIEYRFDTKIKSCLDAIEDGFGDCEEMSSLFIAICRARGIPARAVWIPEHTYAEFYLEDAQGEGHWFPCQLAGTRQFGEMLEAKPILQKGDKFKIPGNSQPLRYAQPTLMAEQTQGELKLRWIAEEAK